MSKWSRLEKKGRDLGILEERPLTFEEICRLNDFDFNELLNYMRDFRVFQQQYVGLRPKFDLKVSLHNGSVVNHEMTNKELRIFYEFSKILESVQKAFEKQSKEAEKK